MGKEKVVVKGYFKKNLGDDLFLKILAEKYPEVDFEVYTKTNYENVFENKNIKFFGSKKVNIKAGRKAHKKIF
jgi:colanic acid/amylovoran biosynthesis protein